MLPRGFRVKGAHQTSVSVHQLLLWISQSHIEYHENTPSQSQIEYHKKNTLKSRRDASMSSKQVIIRLQQACTQCCSAAAAAAAEPHQAITHIETRN